MENVLWALCGAGYMLIGVRAGFIAWEVEKRIGRRDKSWPFWAALLWPIGIVVVGLMVVMLSECGIYDSAYRHDQSDSRATAP